MECLANGEQAGKTEWPGIGVSRDSIATESFFLCGHRINPDGSALYIP